MTDSLRDQLMQLGFKPAPRPERIPERKPERKSEARPHHKAAAPSGARREGGRNDGRGKPRPPRSQEEIDLGKAYALRAQREKDERIEAERQRQEQARLRREAKAAVAKLLDGKALNDAAAEIARHFEYGGKIKRIYVTPDQLKALNAGELGVLQLQGRYLLVDTALLVEAAAIFPECVALKVDPDAPAGDDPYADPQYQVPDDLVW